MSSSGWRRVIVVLLFCGALAALAWAVSFVSSVTDTRSILRSYSQRRRESPPRGVDEAIARLGGAVSAAERLSDYVQYPDCIAPHKESALFLLGVCGELATPELLAALQNSRYSYSLRHHTALALGRVGWAAAPELKVLLSHEEPSTRFFALLALGAMRDARAVELIGPMLKDPEWDVRQGAVYSLAEIASEEVVALLLAALKDKSVDVREAAVASLGDVKAKQAVLPLIGVVTSAVSNEDERWAAATSLGKIGDLRAIAALVGALSDDEEPVQVAACEALGCLGSMDALQALEALIVRSSRLDVRKAAREALEKIKKAQEEKQDKAEPEQPVEAPAK